MRFINGILCLGLLCALSETVSADCSTISYSSTSTCNSASGCSKDAYACARPDFLPFSQGESRSRDYVGQAHLQNLLELDDWNFVAGVAYEYQRNFNEDGLGRYFSPSCGNNKFTVGEETDAGIHIRAEDLGLSPTFRGTLTLNPKIQNHIIEPSFYFGLDRWLEGLYLWTKLPITHTIWAMETCETSTQAGNYYFAESLMADDLTVSATFASGETPSVSGLRTLTAASICRAFSGKHTFGHKDIPLQAGRILCNCPNDKTGVADIPVHLGYNFFNKDRGYIGAYARAVFPTGIIDVNRSIFDPRIGYKRWQVGGGLQGRLRLYENDDQTTSFHVFMDAYATHIFKDTECRLFDLKTGTNRPTDTKWSRYLLLKQLDGNYAYTGRLRNFADVFTVCAKSGFDWLVDGLILFEFHHKNWMFDLGYEIKARDCEDFDCTNLNLCDPCTYDDCDECCSSSHIFRYGIKGLQFVSDATIDPTADIHNAVLAQGSGATPVAANTLGTGDNLSTIVDVNSGMRPRVVALKIFGDIGYTWDIGEFKLFDNQGPIFANVGADVEFGSKNKALRHWGVWGKWGVAYN